MPHTSGYTGKDAIAGDPKSKRVDGKSVQGRPLKVGPAGPLPTQHARKGKGPQGKGQKYFP